MSTPTVVSGINQARLDEKIIEALRFILPAFGSFSYLPSVDENVILNSSVLVPISSDPVAGEKTAGTSVDEDGGAVAGTNVTLNKHFAARWDFNEGTMSPDLFQNAWEDKAVGAVYQLAKKVIDSALALVKVANYGDTDDDKLACAPGSFDQGELSTFWSKAVKKIKNQKMSIGINADYAGALMGQSNLGLVYAASGTNFVQTGQIPSLMGMSAWVYPDMPDNGEGLGGMIVGRGAICVATAPVRALTKGGGSIVERRIITDETTGLSVLYTQNFNTGGNLRGECEILAGVKKGQDSIVRLVTGI